LDKYYKKKVNIKLDNLEALEADKNLQLNKKLHTKIDEILKDGLHQLDFIVLFYISFFDLSIEFKRFLESKKI